MTYIVIKNILHKLIKGRMRALWFSTKLKLLASKKEKFYIRAKKSGKKPDWDKFTRVDKLTVPSEVPIDPVSSVLESDQPKDFWRYVKSRRTDSTGVHELYITILIKRKNHKKCSERFTKEKNIKLNQKVL